MFDKRLILPVLICLASGCAQTKYRASALPSQFAARPVRDFSTVDLTPWARQITNANAIQPGDRLQVKLDPGTLEPESELNWTVSVDDSGQTTLPNIGAVRLAGLSSAEAEKAIVQTSLQRDVFLTPVVDVKIADRVERTILVTGAVTEPGPLTIARDEVSLADVIVRAGGLTTAASGRISVSSAGGTATGPAEPVMPNAVLPVGQTSVAATTVSLESTSGAQLGQMMIPDGAVVHVEENSPRPVKVGGVIRDQIVQLPPGQNMHLLDAITLAGGQTYSNWISDRVTITRRVPGEDRTVLIRGSIRRARSRSEENLVLAPYDVVTVEENIVTFTLSTLSGLFGAGVSAAQIGAF